MLEAFLISFSDNSLPVLKYGHKNENLGCQVSEEKRWGAIENVYSFSEWTDFVGVFHQHRINLKHDSSIGVTALAKAYYVRANQIPDFLLKHFVANI